MHTTYMHEKLELKYNSGKYKKYSLKFLQFLQIGMNIYCLYLTNIFFNFLMFNIL